MQGYTVNILISIFDGPMYAIKLFFMRKQYSNLIFFYRIFLLIVKFHLYLQEIFDKQCHVICKQVLYGLNFHMHIFRYFWLTQIIFFPLKGECHKPERTSLLNRQCINYGIKTRFMLCALYGCFIYIRYQNHGNFQ